MNIVDKFKLKNEREKFQTVIKNIDESVEFKGTNLWILVFAIFIASLGLNMNSTAVIIGAMLISPLMGPIVGLGFGMAINDLDFLKKALSNYLLAAGIGLVTSTIYFFLSPIDTAHSEILSRISPTVYDVLIAFFGGFAGMLAISSKLKGNVIPGVAIATALMPPLCTAGYGLATLQFEFFFGALYLFLINSVFIALATFITARSLKFPFSQLTQGRKESKTKRIAWTIVLVTLLPSIYLAYEMIEWNKFQEKANTFINTEAHFPNDYLLKKNIDGKTGTITLTYGGDVINEKEIAALKSKLSKYDIADSALQIHQGFAYLRENDNTLESKELTKTLAERENKLDVLQKKVDSVDAEKLLGRQIFNELKAQYPSIQSCIIQNVDRNDDSTQKNVWITTIKSKATLSSKEKIKIRNWLKVRLNTNDLTLFFEK